MSAQRIDVKNCSKSASRHPCDTPEPCDPFKEVKEECPQPYLCLEKIKNPALPGEITKCLPGKFLNAKSCDTKSEKPPHPCDPPPPCGTKAKRRPCDDPALCLHRIKNPEPKKKLNPFATPCTPVEGNDGSQYSITSADPEEGTSNQK